MSDAPAASSRDRIVEAAARMLRDGGPAAVTTRGVALAAGVQAPAIYRLFGDKDGLFEAVAEHVMAGYVTAKAAVVEAAAAEGVDPLDDLRSGWYAQVEFGLANPALFALLSDPERVRESPAARSGQAVLEERVRRLALAGLLRVPEERAVDLIAAAGVGSITTLLARPPERRDAGLAVAMFEAVLEQILLPSSAEPAAAALPGAGAGGLGDAARAAAVTLRAAAPGLDALTAAERGLLDDWLARVLDE